MDLILRKVLVPLAAALLTGSALFILRGALSRVVRRSARRRASKVDDAIIDALRVPSLYWCVALAIYLGIAFSELPEKQLSYVSKAIHVILIFSVTVAAANLAGRFFTDYVRKSALPIPSTGLAYGILKGTILSIGILIILSVLGISIAPLITALGVGGLAVALALQDTLANLFAGIHILMEKSVRVGDYIKLETGQEGHVADITWRSTRIRMMPNNMVLIPNLKLAQSIVTNYSLPEREMSSSFRVSVDYSSDPDSVESIIAEEVKKAAGEIKGMLADSEPSVQLVPGFGENGLDFTVSCRITDYASQFPVQHELRKRLLRRFAKEGIEISSPRRLVHLKKEEWRFLVRDAGVDDEKPQK